MFNKKKKNTRRYHVVTGVARSGTSAMMGSLREAGIPLAGYKYPIMLDFGPNEKLCGGAEKPIDPNEVRKNEMGFWEISEVLKEGIQKNTYSGALIKCPCQSFAHSKVHFIKKVVFMVRPPREQIASILKDVSFAKAWDPHAVYAEMCLRQIYTVRFLEQYDIPWIVVQYEKLIDNPYFHINRVCEFFDRGDPEWGAKYIDPSKRRNNKKVNKLQGKYPDASIQLYNNLINGRIEEVVNMETDEMNRDCKAAYYKMVESKEAEKIRKEKAKYKRRLRI